MPELLLELLSEEIPARMQKRAAADLSRLVTDGLKKAGLDFDAVHSYATPRRLALVVEGLPVTQPDVSEEKKGPATAAPEQAVNGFLKANGLASVDDCEVRDVKGKPTYFFVVEKKGGKTADVLPVVLNDIFHKFPWPKSMRWGTASHRWVRPMHGVLCVFNGKAVEGVAFGDRVADNKTSGHRFLAPKSFTVKDFDDYRGKLDNAKVMLDAGERRTMIQRNADDLAKAAGVTVRPDIGLLDEVAGLVEWPVVLMGGIDDAFMDVPPEVLIAAMRGHQKYFSCLDADGNLAPKFIVVSDMETSDNGAAIVAGNERVLRARLSDARFFWDTDCKHTLESRLGDLGDIVFHAKLGTVADKTDRMVKLAGTLAASIDGCDGAEAQRAAQLCKADLVSGMVGEFAALQGVMGGYYARNDGETDAVADAIAEHYAPAGPNDTCPAKPVSVAVSLADKIDTLIGFWSIDEKPTGSKDPFALRRAALGVIRLITENNLRLSLLDVFGDADLLSFFADRLKVHLKEQGVRHDLIDAVFALGEDDLVRVLMRVEALGDFVSSDDGANLLAAHKRAANILKIEEKKDSRSYDGEASEGEEPEEKALHAALKTAGEACANALKDEDFAAAMTALAALRGPVDAFFDEVTVNCDDKDLRENRLKLLSGIRAVMGRLADFSKIEG
ncbi:MAG: glycine--tRNA ligase subunit beta [Alphaproteobacteria bacterium]